MGIVCNDHIVIIIIDLLNPKSCCYYHFCSKFTFSDITFVSHAYSEDNIVFSKRG